MCVQVAEEDPLARLDSDVARGPTVEGSSGVCPATFRFGWPRLWLALDDCLRFGRGLADFCSTIEERAGMNDQVRGLDVSEEPRSRLELDGAAADDVATHRSGEDHVLRAHRGFEFGGLADEKELLGTDLTLELSVDARIPGKVDAAGDRNAGFDLVPKALFPTWCTGFRGNRGALQVGHDV